MPGPCFILSLLIAVATAVWSLFSLSTASTVFCAIAWLWALLLVGHLIFVRPRTGHVVPLLPEEEVVRREHFAALTFPIASNDMSVALNNFRLLGAALQPFLLFQHLWWQAGALVVLFFATGEVVVRLSPWHYYPQHAARGNPLAAKNLATLQMIRRDMDGARTVNSSKRSEGS